MTFIKVNADVVLLKFDFCYYVCACNCRLAQEYTLMFMPGAFVSIVLFTAVVCSDCIMMYACIHLSMLTAIFRVCLDWLISVKGFGSLFTAKKRSLRL